MYGKQIVNHIGGAVRRYMESGLAARAAKKIDSLEPGSGLGGDVVVVGGGTTVATELGPSSIPATGDFCINCEAPLAGKFCAQCGQKDKDIRRPVWSFLIDFGDDILSLDSRIIQTLGPLLFLPGSLTKSFWKGHRARYVPPVRLYIFSSLFFFLVVLVTDVAILRFEMVPKNKTSEAVEVAEAFKQLDDGTFNGADDAERVEKVLDDALSQVDQEQLENSGIELGVDDNTAITINDDDFDLDVQMFAPITDEDKIGGYSGAAFDDALGDLAEEKADADEGEAELIGFFEKVVAGFERATQEPKQLNSALNDSIPLVMVILLPVFAMLLRVFYWGKNGRLVKHLIFSLHFHSYIFLVLAFLIIAQKAWGAEISSTLFFAAVPLYLFLGLKVASEQGWFRTGFKFIFISLFYTILLSSAAMAAVLLGLSEI